MIFFDAATATDVPVWVAFGVAAIGGSPGWLAWWRSNRKDTEKKTQRNAATALDGYEHLVDELRKELERRAQTFERDLTASVNRAESECADKLKVAQKKYDNLAYAHEKLEKRVEQECIERIKRAVEETKAVAQAHNALDEQTTGGEHQVGEVPDET